MITIRNMTHADTFPKNEPFPLFGRIIVRYDGTSWTYTTEEFPPSARSEMVFPEEEYDLDAADFFYTGAFDGDTCVGLAVWQRDMFRYLYLYDLKVTGAYRRHGVGKLLIDAGMEIARGQGLIGVCTIVQDNNLAAARFYLKSGFAIGGLNTRIYDGTSQADKHDIYLYKIL